MALAPRYTVDSHRSIILREIRLLRLWGLVRQDGVVVDGCREVGGFVSREHFSASDLIALGYAADRLTSVFGEPDSVDGESLWDRETVVAIERDVLAPAVRVLWDAFAPEWNTRLRMQGVVTVGVAADGADVGACDDAADR